MLAFVAVCGCGVGWKALVVVNPESCDGAGVNREAAGCLGVLVLNNELVDAAGLGVVDSSGSSSTAGLGANSEPAVEGFGVLALKREDVENDCVGLTVAGASGAFSAAGVGVAGTPNPLLAPENRFFAGAVAGGATEKPENGFEALGAGVALTV